jgi:hypothetical protein
MLVVSRKTVGFQSYPSFLSGERNERLLLQKHPRMGITATDLSPEVGA